MTMALNLWRQTALVAIFPAVLFMYMQQHAAEAFLHPKSNLQQPMVHQRPQQQYQKQNPITTSSSSINTSLFLSSSDIQAKLLAQMAKLQERDRSSREISPDVSVAYHFTFLYFSPSSCLIFILTCETHQMHKLRHHSGPRRRI